MSTPMFQDQRIECIKYTGTKPEAKFKSNPRWIPTNLFGLTLCLFGKIYRALSQFSEDLQLFSSV